MIRITSKREGFRRCGIAHPKTAVDYPDDRFSEEELAKLKAEPMLLVEKIKDPVAPEEAQKPETGKLDESGKQESPPEETGPKVEEKAPETLESGADGAGSPPEGSGEVEQPAPRESEYPDGHESRTDETKPAEDTSGKQELPSGKAASAGGKDKSGKKGKR